MPEDQAPSQRSYLSLAGHPIHALSVPLPIGLYAASTVSALLALRRRDAFWHRAAMVSGVSAVVAAAGVAVPGTTDYLTLVRSKRALRVGAVHILLNGGAMCLQGLAVALGADRQRLVRRRATGYGLLQLGAMTMASLAGFAGGELVYRHRIGVFGDERGDEDQ